MRALLVVVLDVGPQDSIKVPRAKDQRPVQTPAPKTTSVLRRPPEKPKSLRFTSSSPLCRLVLHHILL